MRFFLAIPTYNGGELWKSVAYYIRKNAGKDACVQVIDSGSTDETVNISEYNNFNIKSIDKKNFNHGGTRNYVVNLLADQHEIVIFLTQDAIPQPGFIKKIITAFSDPSVACAYGRQLAHDNATPIAKYARDFNYQKESYIYSFDDIKRIGLKAAFISNSFSAYRVSIFQKLNGFPENTILCEDMHFSARALLDGYKIAYVSDAVVKHSHNYSFKDEFKRYFDIGVFHSMEPWINYKFGGAGEEGKRYVFSELNYLLKSSFLYIPKSLVNDFMKIIGYKLGKNYKFIPKIFIKSFSMHKNYWG
ncbi:MAG: glycosyltransferase family 2 protein [Candidatus Malihini olakiniferum]